MGSKVLQQAYNKPTTSLAVGEASRKLGFTQESENGKSILLFFVKPAKKQKYIKIKYAQKHFKSAWVTTLITEKKAKFKIVKKRTI